MMPNEANAPKHFVCILLSTLILNCSVRMPTAFVWAKHLKHKLSKLLLVYEHAVGHVKKCTVGKKNGLTLVGLENRLPGA